MTSKDLILKILYQDAEMKTAQWVIGMVDSEQFYSIDNHLIEVKNRNSVTIGKQDIEDVIICKEYHRVVIDKNSLAINRPVSMES